MQLSRRLFVIAGVGVTFASAAKLRCYAQEIAGIPVSTSQEKPPGLVDFIQLPPLRNSRRNPVVTAMALHQKTNTLAAAGDDHAVRWIDIETGKTLATLEGHTDWVRQLHFVKAEGNNLRLLSCGDDGRIFSWNWDFKVTPPEVARSLILECEHTIYSLAFDPIEQRFAAGGFSHDIFVGPLNDHTRIQKFQCDCGDQRAFIFSRDGQTLFVGGRDGAIHVFDLASGKMSHEHHVHRSRLRSLALSSDGKVLTSVGEDRFVNRIDWQSGQTLLTNQLASGKLLAVEPVTDELLAIASADNTVQVINAATGESNKRLIGHDGSVAVLLYENNRLFTAGYDTTIRIWDLDKTEAGALARGAKLIRHSIPSKFLDSGVNDTTY